MNTLFYPGQADISAALLRPSGGNADIDGSVREVLARVKTEGDAALREYSKKFDGYAPASFRVNEDSLREAEKSVPPELRDAMREAISNITAFHSCAAANFRAGDYSRRCEVLEPRCGYREGGALYPRRNGTAFLNRSDAGHTQLAWPDAAISSCAPLPAETARSVL